MPNYQNGKIYALKSHQTEDIYIGSTTQRLCQRLGKHRADCKDNKGNTKYILQYEDYYIELIENFPCNSKEELEKREGHFIRENKNKCVNTRIPHRSQKEYKEENKDKIKEYTKEYREENKDKIKAKQKEYQKENRETLIQKKAVYNEANREVKNEKGREYYYANKEKVLNRNKEKHTCICGMEYTLGHKSRHEKTMQHQDFFKSI
jgi:hypothetical protein